MVKKKKPEKVEPKEKKEKKPSLPASSASSTTKAKKTLKPSKEVSTPASKEPENPLGKKFSCVSCSTKFYDMNKPQKICPKCGQDQSLKVPQKVKGGKANKFSEYDILEDDPVGIIDPEIGIDSEIDLEDEPIIDEEDV